jgi:hypothetical protein
MRTRALLLTALALTVGSVAVDSRDVDPRNTDPRDQEPGHDSGPRFDEDGLLLRPDGWQRWTLAGSSLGLGYTPRTRGTGPGTFKHVYINPSSFDHYVQTGEFPDQTMLVLAVYSSEDRAEPAENGWYPDRLRAMEAAVKDEERFEGGWAYFDLDLGPDSNDGAKAFPAERCASCHDQHAAVDNVFVQFYPVLRDARAVFEKGR